MGGCQGSFEVGGHWRFVTGGSPCLTGLGSQRRKAGWSLWWGPPHQLLQRILPNQEVILYPRGSRRRFQGICRVLYKLGTTATKYLFCIKGTRLHTHHQMGGLEDGLGRHHVGGPNLRSHDDKEEAHHGPPIWAGDVLPTASWHGERRQSPE
jgi:hypothetical protein